MKNYTWLLFIYFIALICACTGPQGSQGIPGVAGPVATTPTAEPLTTIEELVNNYNMYRENNGNEPLVAGLDCTLYTVPTSTTKIVGATLTNIESFSYNGVFNQPNTPVTDGLNILPLPVQSVYQTWYIVKCTGYLFNIDDNTHSFSLSSDDGSNLYISGLLINNDGLHSITTVSAIKNLNNLQPYSFELDFMQAAGQQALILNEDGNVMNSNQFYH